MLLPIALLVGGLFLFYSLAVIAGFFLSFIPEKFLSPSVRTGLIAVIALLLSLALLFRIDHIFSSFFFDYPYVAFTGFCNWWLTVFRKQIKKKATAKNILISILLLFVNIGAFLAIAYFLFGIVLFSAETFFFFSAN
ncbi:MAG: hypothetical protein QM687_13730 [Ferruginibacter sp.]